MSGAVAQAFAPPVFHNPAAFSQAVVTGELDATQLTFTEAVLENEGLAELAELLEAVRQGHAVSRSEIETQARRHETKVRTALARGASWQVNWTPPKLFDQVTPAMLAPLRPKLPQEQRVGAVVGETSRARGASSHPQGLAAEEAVTHVGSIELVPDKRNYIESLVGVKPYESSILGSEWKQAFHYVLDKVLPGEGDVFERGWEALKDPSVPIPAKVVFLRLAGDDYHHVNSLEKFLTIHEGLFNIVFAEDGDPYLKAMTHWFMMEFNRWETSGYFLVKANVLLEGKMLGWLELEPLQLPGGLLITKEMLEPFRERVVALTDRLDSRVVPGLSDLPPLGGAERHRWSTEPHAPPPWPKLLPQWLGIEGSEVELARQASQIFMRGEPEWRYIMALAYYSFLISPESGVPITLQEANQMVGRLISLVEYLEPTSQPYSLLGGTDHLPRMAFVVLPRVLERRRRTVREQGGGLEERLATEHWALGRLNGLREALGSDLQTKFFAGWDVAMNLEAQREALADSIRELDPPWWHRLGRWLASFNK